MPSRYHLFSDAACVFIGSLHSFTLLILGNQFRLTYPAPPVLQFKLQASFGSCMLYCLFVYQNTIQKNSLTAQNERKIVPETAIKTDSLQKLKSYNDSRCHFRD